MNLESYTNRALCDEIRRRAQNGSDLLKYNIISTYSYVPGKNYDSCYYTRRCNEGSRRSQNLKFKVSDQDLMAEIQRRIGERYDDAAREYVMMLADAPHVSLTIKK
jgi:hypothetical protein